MLICLLRTLCFLFIFQAYEVFVPRLCPPLHNHGKMSGSKINWQTIKRYSIEKIRVLAKLYLCLKLIVYHCLLFTIIKEVIFPDLSFFKLEGYLKHLLTAFFQFKAQLFQILCLYYE